MSNSPDNKGTGNSSDNKGAGNPAGAAGAAPQAASASAPASNTTTNAAAGAALAVREGGADENPQEYPPEDTRLSRLAMQLDVMVRVHSFRVQDLLSMEKGTVIETVHEHGQDVPLRCGGAVLLWSEFEVLDQQLAVRVTRLG
jgi:flagellar motor switch protein FliN